MVVPIRHVAVQMWEMVNQKVQHTLAGHVIILWDTSLFNHKFNSAQITGRKRKLRGERVLSTGVITSDANANHKEDWNWIQDECLWLRYAIDGLMCITKRRRSRGLTDSVM